MYDMQFMHIRGLDLSHLELLAAVAELGSISAAASRVGLSQSAASHALAGLRKRIGDPLFVRTAKGFQPTTHGARAAAAARRSLEAIRSGLEPPRKIEPDKLKGVLRLYL